jgi:hypothetical protein
MFASFVAEIIAVSCCTQQLCLLTANATAENPWVHFQVFIEAYCHPSWGLQ